jgi:hypothetical protein
LVSGLFCDLHEAFDSVNPDILLSKLELYGITGTVHNLIRSYLQDIYQRVLVNSASNKYNSKWESVIAAVPQESIFGPLLFILYVNDMSDISNPVLYLDDISLIITNSNVRMFEKI